MKLLDPTYISQICDYSFGDQSGHQCGICLMKPANSNNLEFRSKVQDISKYRSFMTLFIDNIRLYNRDIEATKESDKSYVDNLLKENDLLKLCSEFPFMRFIIFTGFEDTPIDKFIFDKIPENVIKIFASNAISFGNKVNAIPYGLQRKMNFTDNRQEILLDLIKRNFETQPEKLLYINHNVNTNISERGNISELFSNKTWVSINLERLDYLNYLNKIKQHKFMICPSGNAVGCECHRDWEVLYMRRVPIVKESVYLREIFKGFPVLFVKDFADVSEKLLIENNHLFEESKKLDLNKLDMEILYNTYIDELNIKNKNEII